MADVHQLVSEDALDLVTGHGLPQPLGDAHHGVVGVAAGGEGVGLQARRDGHGGHRQVGALGQAADHPVQLGRLGGRDHAGACRP